MFPGFTRELMRHRESTGAGGLRDMARFIAARRLLTWILGITLLMLKASGQVPLPRLTNRKSGLRNGKILFRSCQGVAIRGHSARISRTLGSQGSRQMRMDTILCRGGTGEPSLPETYWRSM